MCESWELYTEHSRNLFLKKSCWKRCDAHMKILLFIYILELFREDFLLVALFVD